MKNVGKYELRNKKLEKEFAKQNKQKGEEESKTIKQEEIQHKVESEKSIKKKNGVVSGKNGEDNNSVTFKEERKQFIQGLSRAQSYGQIVTAQYVAEQRQIKMLQAIERLKKQQQIVEDEEQEL